MHITFKNISFIFILASCIIRLCYSVIDLLVFAILGLCLRYNCAIFSSKIHIFSRIVCVNYSKVLYNSKGVFTLVVILLIILFLVCCFLIYFKQRISSTHLQVFLETSSVAQRLRNLIFIFILSRQSLGVQYLIEDVFK